MRYFGIGLQRTGTTSLHEAAQILGLRSAPMSIALFYNLNDPIIHQYELFSDNPIPLLYPELDNRYPHSKFILTTRPVDDWLKSVQWLFEVGITTLPSNLRQAGDDIHQQFYGRTTFDTDHFCAFWHNYHAQISTYFQNRPQDLLIIDFTRGDGWEQLCSFLGLPIPSTPFPHRNQAYTSTPWGRLKDHLRIMRHLR